jgi:hypothetical protein
MKFYIGMNRTENAWPFERSMFSINLLWNNFKPFKVNKWLLDSGGYSQIAKFGRYISSPKWYVWRMEKLRVNGSLVGAMAQDWQCQPIHLAKTGFTKEKHQELTVKSYVDLQALTDIRIIPVLQGHHARDYVNHVKMYGDILKPGTWVAVGGVAARQNQPGLILKILEGIKSERSDLRLHGFGLKLSSLQYESIVDLLFTADSINWVMNVRWDDMDRFTRFGYHLNDEQDPRHALKFAHKIQSLKGIENIIYGPKKSLERTEVLVQGKYKGLYERFWKDKWEKEFMREKERQGYRLVKEGDGDGSELHKCVRLAGGD